MSETAFLLATLAALLADKGFALIAVGKAAPTACRGRPRATDAGRHGTTRCDRNTALKLFATVLHNSALWTRRAPRSRGGPHDS